MDITPTGSYNIACFVDANFRVLWNSENDQGPICVKSRMGFVIMLMGCPLMWISKLLTRIALSIMEYEYIVLSHSMRELICIR